jgi:hypothetical protein
VGFNPLELAPDLRVDSVAQLGRIALSHGAFVNASGNGGGVVLLRGGHLFVDHAWMFADNTGPVHGAGVGLDLGLRADAVIRNGAFLTTDSFGAGRARDLRLTAGRVHLDGGAVIGSRAYATGDSGHTVVRVGTLTITGGGQLDSSTQADAAGHGGRLTVTATDAIAITGPESGLVSVAHGTGRVGEITVEARQLTLTGGAVVRNHAFSSNNRGGRVTLTASEAVVVAGGSSVSSNGPITISAPTVRLQAGIVGNPTYSISDAADIVITAGEVTLTEGARIISNTLGAGRGGDIRIQGDRVTLTGGATIRSETLSSGAEAGAGGRITLTATDGITVAGPTSGLFSNTQSRGLGGDITLQARELRLTDEATISALSSGAGDAGRLTLTATEHLRLDRSTLTARSTQANGGVIVLQAGHGVQLWDGSTITASVEGGPTTVGGNLTITAPFVVLEGSQEGRQIIAQATEGTGGRIVITSPVLLAEPTPADPTGLARVSASSTEGGISGVVDIRAPVTTLSGAVAPLPQAFVNVAALLPARCAARLSGGTYSSLVMGGRGGLPLEPGGVLPSPLRLDARLAADAAGDGGQSRQMPRVRGALLAAEEQGFPRLPGAEALGLAPAVRDGWCPP